LLASHKFHRQGHPKQVHTATANSQDGVADCRLHFLAADSVAVEFVQRSPLLAAHVLNVYSPSSEEVFRFLHWLRATVSFDMPEDQAVQLAALLACVAAVAVGCFKHCCDLCWRCRRSLLLHQ
jgi:hypothetical protein